MKSLYILTAFMLLFCSKKKDNEKQSIHINSAKENLKNDTILKQKYLNNKLEYVILAKDSLGSDELHITYYENGNVKEKGLIGIVSNKDVNTKASIQTWFYYDKLNNLDSTIYYNNDEFKKDFIEKKSYYKNGKLKTLEKYNNYILYENEKDSTGIWKKYNEDGKLYQTINYNKKY